MSRGFELLELLKEELDVVNFLSAPITSNEEEPREIIEGELGEEPEGGDWEAYEERVEEELGRRGEFYPVSELVELIETYEKYFKKHQRESFNLGSHRQVTGETLFKELEYLKEELEKIRGEGQDWSLNNRENDVKIERKKFRTINKNR